MEREEREKRAKYTREREREWERGNDNMKNKIEKRIKNTRKRNLIKIHEYYENLKRSKSEAF